MANKSIDNKIINEISFCFFAFFGLSYEQKFKSLVKVLIPRGLGNWLSYSSMFAVSIGTVFGNAIKIYLDTFYTQQFHLPRTFTLTLLVKVKNWKHCNCSLVVECKIKDGVTIWFSSFTFVKFLKSIY